MSVYCALQQTGMVIALACLSPTDGHHMSKTNLLIKSFLVLALLYVCDTAADSLDILYIDADKTGINTKDPLAQAKLKRLIADIERQEGAFSKQLYRPIRQMGLAQQLASDHVGALDSFRRLQHLVHRHYGVYSEYQIESIGFMIDSYRQLGDIKSIDRESHFRLNVARHADSDDPATTVYAALQLADWYRNTLRYSRALALYEESRTLIEQNKTEIDYHDLRLRILRSEAFTMYLAGRCCATEKLQSAVSYALSVGEYDRSEISSLAVDSSDIRILEKSKQELPDTYRSTGDKSNPQFLGFSNHQAFLNMNRRALNPFVAVNSKHIEFGRNDEPLLSFGTSTPPPVSVGQPVPMCGTTFQQLARTATNKDTYINVSLTIDETGSPGHIELEGNAPGKLKRYLRASLLASRFRPAATSEGEQVPSNLTFRQTFSTTDVIANSNSKVSSWNNMLVAQACQFASARRI